MSSRWHYRIHGRDVGPVDFATLQLMAREERLFADDEIREEASPAWVLAGTVAGLFPESADEDDLSSMLSDAEMPAATDDRVAPNDACFCRTRTEELGPMRFERLVSLARTGRLGRRDQVRVGTQGMWVEARSVVGLFDVPVTSAAAPGEAASEAASILDSFEIVADPTPKPVRAPRPAPEPVLQLVDEGSDGKDDVAPVGVPDTEAKWHCRVLGQEIGPIGWDDLRELVESRQLGPNDRVRKGQSVAWVPAGTIDNLFPKRKKVRLAKKKQATISEEDVLDILAPDEPDEEEVSSHVAPQRSFGKPARPSNAEIPLPRPQSSGEIPAMNAAAGAAPARGAVAASPSPRAAIAPMPVPAPSKRGSTSGGLSRQVQNLQMLLAHSWKPIAGIAAAIVLVAAAIYGSQALFAPETRPTLLYEQTERMWTQAEKLRSARDAAGWGKFQVRYKERITTARSQIEVSSNSRDRLTQLLLRCYREHLPKIIESPVDGANEAWTAMAKDMDEAKTLAQ